MRHITDMMASGEVANEILGRGIEISRVRIVLTCVGVNNLYRYCV